MTDPSHNTLAETLTHYSIEMPDDMVAQLDDYCRLLWQWNEKLNLTRHTDYQRFVTRDVVDSLQLAALLEPDEEVLDLGTGGGVPGVVIAVVRPDLQVSLCESVAKRAKAIDQIVGQLKLPVPVHHARVDKLLEDFRYDTIVARAVAPLGKMLHWLSPHWISFRRLLVVKGSRWVEERKDARRSGLLQNLELRRAAVYETPDTDAENVILQIWPKDGLA